MKLARGFVLLFALIALALLVILPAFVAVEIHATAAWLHLLFG